MPDQGNPIDHRFKNGFRDQAGVNLLTVRASADDFQVAASRPEAPDSTLTAEANHQAGLIINKLGDNRVANQESFRGNPDQPV